MLDSDGGGRTLGQRRVPSELAFPSVLTALGFSSSRQAIFNFPEGFMEQMAKPFQLKRL